MISFILRMFGMDIPDGPIVFVDNTSILPTTTYDVKQNVSFDRNDDAIEFNEDYRNRGKKIDNLILSHTV